MKIDVSVSSPVPRSSRVMQVAGMFDVPMAEASAVRWSFDFPFEDKPWSVGLITRPSGSGKSTIARRAFGDPLSFSWGTGPVIDGMPDVPLEDIAAACQAVGFNTIPAWFRPFHVLSNGERFRAEIARALLSVGETLVIDEFTSVVDRQVGRICSHAMQKAVRARGRRFVAITCHDDVEEWLQPDWVLEPATGSFRWRSVRRRPELAVRIERVERTEEWPRFAPFHYMSAELSASARCYGLFMDGVPKPVAFAAILHRMISAKNGVNTRGISRLVTLPDYQGLGLAMALSDALGAMYAAVGDALNMYPAHPALIRTFDRSPRWLLQRAPKLVQGSRSNRGASQGRPCATFRYVGPTHPDRAFAAAMVRDADATDPVGQPS